MTNHKKAIFILFLAAFIFTGAVTPKSAKAFSPGVVAINAAKWGWERLNDVIDIVKETVVGELGDRTVAMFLDQLAYDVATELAEGGPGGKPQFRTVSIGDSLENAGQAAFGEFLGELTSKGFNRLGIDLCDPSIELKLSLTLNLIDGENPPSKTLPRNCDWNRLRKNWAQFDDNVQASIIKFELNPVQSGVTSTRDFFDGIFSKKGSDLGIAGELALEVNKRKQIALEIEKISAVECRGYQDKKTTVSEEVITHCVVTYGLARDLFSDATEAETKRQLARREAADANKLSDILKDAGNRFVNTFTSKLMNNWIKKGMWSLFGDDGDIYENTREDLINKLRGYSDIRQPRGSDVFKEIKTVNIETIEDFSYINDFSICPNQFRSPDNCVMSPSFLQAINSQVTVQQAIDQGIIDGETLLVNKDDAINHTVDKCYRDGLCYANLVKLRKANMIPVGWELAALRAPVTLQQAIDCFEESETCAFDIDETPDNEFMVDGNFHNPFYHLVDPDWVLKAPAVRCEAYAYTSVLESPDTSSRQQYCADPKVCLQEDSDGNCLDDQFNYCTRSENIWNFEGEACAAGDIYAGCLTFANEDFGDNSYIQDTLEYCTSNQAGCRRYSQDKDGAGDWVLGDVESPTTIDLFLNKQAADCSAEEAGCSEYIVLAADTGTNLVPNGSFADLDANGIPDGWSSDGINDPDGTLEPSNVNNIPLEYDGNRVPNGYTYGDPRYGHPSPTESPRIAVDGEAEGVSIRFSVLPNTIYNLSVDASQYDNARSDTARISVGMHDGNVVGDAAGVADIGTCLLGVGGNDNHADLIFTPNSTNMERGSCTFMTNDFVDNVVVAVQSAGSGAIWFDNLKLEIISSTDIVATSYSSYGEGSKIYMNDDAVMCSVAEVGCQGYIPNNGDPMIPAVINQGDLCPAECVGYDTFTEQPNIFDTIEHPTNQPPVEYYNFIASSARQCPDQEVGCEEFTNLDELAQGGEGREYFTYLRQCVEEALGTVYYTWEGTEVSGYQIKTWYSLASGEGNPTSPSPEAPCTNMDPSGSNCLDTATNMALCGPDTADTSDDPEYNPNCREFFDINGTVHYRLQDRVIFATDNCHDYRRTATDQIYKAVPEESIHCSQANNGCSSYYGNNANNVRIALTDNFEQGTYEPWFGIGAGSTVDLSNESLNNNGHSLKGETNDFFARDMRGVQLQNNKEYIVSWWMKSEATLDDFSLILWGNDNNVPAGNFSTTFADSTRPTDSVFQNIEPGRWHYYTASAYVEDLDLVDMDNIQTLGFQIASFSSLSDLGLYIDNFTIKEVENSFSVIKDSWNTPISCDTPYEGYHLGCQAYQDLNNQDFNLKSFDSLCREEAIGCTPVIDTYNSSNPFAETFNNSDYSEITVEADNITYLVPNPNNYCSKEYKGCSELGLPNRLDDTQFETVYKINDPDKYSSILCDYDGLGCSEYNTAKGTFYLKDPGLDTCTYQQNVLINGSLLSGWFKTTSLSYDTPLGCADTDDNADSNGDGIYDVAELILPRDYCSISEADKTQLPFFTQEDCESQTPPGYWNNYIKAAQCPASEDTCTTFKDPVDPIACDPKGRNIDFVEFDGFCIDNITKNHLDIDKASCQASSLYTWILPSRDGYCSSDIYNNEKDCTDVGQTWTPYCREYYYYDNENIDEKSCNGLVDREDGCVLFYDANNWNGEHSQVGLSYDADETYEDVEVYDRAVSPISCDPSFDPTCSLNANKLIKVSKDRQCAEWLACKSSTASLDDETDEYKIICDDLDTCVEFQYDPDSNTTKCKKWGSYDEDVEPLTIEKYQSRNTGLKNYISWSDKEYTGYSIPNMLPVSELSVYSFGDTDDSDIRLVYNITDRVSGTLGNYYSGCVDTDPDTGALYTVDDQSCTAKINTGDAYSFRGECQQGTCWVNPKVNQSSISATETRAYSAIDAPFPAGIEGEGVQRLSKYDQANICSSDPDSPNSCEESYKKVTYGQNQLTLYYPDDEYNPDILTGYCASGITTGDEPGTYKECTKNSDCDSKNDDAVASSRGDGTCVLKTEEVTFRNWPGICLEYDLNNPVVKDVNNSYYCNQWYPAQKIKGTASLYNNYRKAGYYNPQGKDALFCAVAEPYVTTEDRFYCGYFENGIDCNVLIRIPSGSKVNVDMAGQYPELLDSGSWIEYTENLVTPANFDHPGDADFVPRDTIRTFGQKFDRITHFNNVEPDVSDFMDIINNMFDATESDEPIHRYYWDVRVAVNGAFSPGAFVNVPMELNSLDQSGSNCSDCPSWIYDTPEGAHTVYIRCWQGGHCGFHKWRHGLRYSNPLTFNYYVDVSDPNEDYTPPPANYLGSCGANCQYVDNGDADYARGRACLENSFYAPRYTSILNNANYLDALGNFSVSACTAAESNDNDCLYVNCVNNLAVEDLSVHSCNEYSACQVYVSSWDDTSNTEVLLASSPLYDDVQLCIESNWDKDLPQITDLSQYDTCLANNEDLFSSRRFVNGSFQNVVDQDALDAYCSTCALEILPSTYDSLSLGTDCDATDSLDCYQQCRIVTQLDSEGLLSAVRTDIWWRSKNEKKRLNEVTPWISWYWDPVNAYVASEPLDTNGSPNANDDEVVYDRIIGLDAMVDPDDETIDYPKNFDVFGAGLSVFDRDSIVSTRAPYYKVSEDNITTGTFFGYYDQNNSGLTLEESLDAAQVQMQDIFFRVFNLDWVSDSSFYQEYGAFELAGGNNGNIAAGADYRPRVLSNCGDDLCETLDAEGNVTGVEEGITVNNLRSGILIGLDGSLFVNAKFFYHAHPDHMPVYSIDVDWGDGVINNFSLNPGKYKNSLPEDYCDPDVFAPGLENQLMGFGGTDDACQTGYKIFYHDYLYDDKGFHTCNGGNTGAPGTPAKPVEENASCYQPRIRVMDNWGWFTVQPFDGWIVVHDE